MHLKELVEAFDDIRAHCHDLLQQGIDIRFARDGGPPVTLDAAVPVLVWKRDVKGIDLTLMETVSQGILTEASWVHRRDGALIGRSEDLPDPEWHESFRFRRNAYTAQDVFDAYRNTYLALEALLSSLVPRSREREVDWLERALATVQHQHGIDLAAFEVGGGTPALWVQRQYEAFRCALFHAKADGRGRWLPGDSDATIRVSAALMSLEPLVRHLSSKVFSTNSDIGVSPIRACSIWPPSWWPRDLSSVARLITLMQAQTTLR